MVLALVIMFVSGVLLVTSASWLLKETTKLSSLLHLSPMFMALTLVAIGTSLPELTVSGLSLKVDDFSLANGNIVGSNITNATLVFSLAILARKIKLSDASLPSNINLMLLVTGIYLISYLASGRAQLHQAGTLIGVGIGATLWSYYHSTRLMNDQEKILTQQLHHLTKGQTHRLWRVMLQIIISLILLVLSGQLLVGSTQYLAIQLGVASGVLGITLTSLVTSFPEIVTVLVAQRSQQPEMALGNIVGSNIYNLSIIGGLISLNQTDKSLGWVEMGYLLLASLFLAGVVKKFDRQVVPAWVGIGGILLYVLFIIQTYLFALGAN